MKGYNGGKVCEIVGLFLLNNLANKIDKNSVGLYRDRGLTLFNIINGNCANKIRKKFYQLSEETEYL